MTSITWREGGPLMTPGGLIGGSPACCCENPPPPVCVCPDTCSYFIEVVSPSFVAVKSTAACARTVAGVTAAQADAPFTLPDGYEFCGYLNPNSCRGEAINSVLESELSAYIGYACDICTPDDDDFNVAIVGITCLAEIGCNSVAGGNTSWSMKVEVRARVAIYNPVYNPWEPPISERVLWLTQDIPLTPQCDSDSRRLCFGSGGDQVSHIPTPLTVIATGEGSDLGGGYVVSSDRSSGPDAALAESIAQHFLDQLSVTFRITSRRSCQSAPCSCSAAAGTEWTFSNGTRSKTFAYGTDDVEWGGAPYYWSWDGVGYLVLEIFDPADYVPGIGGLVIERHTVQITCDTVDDVSTWMASVFSQCVQYDNVPQITHETYDEWAGVFECVPGCEDEHRAAGDPVLDGELVDVEYLGRSTAVGTTECTPPPRISISVKQIVTC